MLLRYRRQKLYEFWRSDISTFSLLWPVFWDLVCGYGWIVCDTACAMRYIQGKGAVEPRLSSKSRNGFSLLTFPRYSVSPASRGLGLPAQRKSKMPQKCDAATPPTSLNTASLGLEPVECGSGKTGLINRPPSRHSRTDRIGEETSSPPGPKIDVAKNFITYSRTAASP